MNGEFFRREEAKVSVFDSGFLVGDGVWEGIRLHDSEFAFLDLHLDRLFEGAKAIGLDIGMTREEVTAVLRETVRRNGMESGVHVRLMVTRGDKKTPSQDPRLAVGGPNVIVIAEHKVADPGVKERGIRLFTSSVRRPPPDTLDQRLNFLSHITNVLLIRDPTEMLPSLAEQLPSPTMRDTGLREQAGILDAILSHGGEPVVLDARELLLHPPGVLRSACSRLGIPFEEAMLSWPAGPKPEDGVWAGHWYHSVHASTGFAPYRPHTEPFPQRLKPLLQECLPIYERLQDYAIRATA